MTDDSDSDSDDIAKKRSSMWAGELDSADQDEDATEETADTEAEASEDVREPEEDTMNTTDSHDDTGATDAKGANDAWEVTSIREMWHPNSIRLPETIQHEFNSEFKRLDYELRDADADFTKDRQYKPLVISLGLRELEDLEETEILELIEEMQAGDLP